MISKSILKQDIRNNWKVWLTITLTTTAFLILIAWVLYIRKDDINRPDFHTRTMIEMLQMSFYGVIALLLPMVYSIFVGNKLVSMEVDKRTLSNYLNTPIKRTKIVITKTFFFVLSLILMMAILTVAGLFASGIFDLALDLEIFFILNLGLLLYHFAISGIVFFSSSYFDSSGNAMAVGAGIPVGFFVLSIVAGLDESLEFINNFILNSLFIPADIIEGVNIVLPFLGMLLIGVLGYICGIIYFDRKDLHI